MDSMNSVDLCTYIKLPHQKDKEDSHEEESCPTFISNQINCDNFVL